MNLTRSKKKDLLYVAVAAFFFLTACVLQTVDDYISDLFVKKTIALLTQYIFFGLLAYWTASVISRISDKSICSGIIVAIALMGGILFVRLLKYHVFYEETATRYLWYSYYIPQCIAPVVLLLTILGMGRQEGRPLSKGWYMLFLPAAMLIILVFTNDLHEQVFSFAEGLEYSNKKYKWEWGYYLILSWMVGLYLSIGVLLYVKCRISWCRKKAWIPLVLFVTCFILCVLREVFDPSFIRMPEAVVFSVVIVFESLIRIGFIPSNVNHEGLFYLADISASIADKNLNVVLSSKNAPEITREQATLAANGTKTQLSEDLVARQKRMAEMEARKSVLALKQEMVAAVFEEARRELSGLPGEEYVAFLAKMASEAASSGTEELLLNERDKAASGKAVCKAANALLTAKGMHGGLTLSEDTADIAGGLILRQGGIEVNCAVDTLIEQQRGSLSAQVAAELFE